MALDNDDEEEISQSLLEEDDSDFGETPEEDGDEGEGGDEEADHAEAEEGETLEGHGQQGKTEGPRVGRANKAIVELRKRAQREEAQRQSLERQIQELQSRVSQPQVDNAQQEAERMALMTSEERMEYKLQRAQQQHQQQLRMMQMQQADLMDRQNFRQLARENKLVGRFADQVETELAKIRQGGGNVDRERLADYLIGRAMRMKSGKAIQDQKKQGATNLRRATVQGGSSRSDVSSNRREANESNSRAKRLEDMMI